MKGWKGWLPAILIVLLGLQVLLFWPRAESSAPMTDEEYDHYIEMLQERNQLWRKLLENQQLQNKHAAGELWSS